MSDLLKHFIDDPLGLLVVGVLGAAKVVEVLTKYIPQWLKLKLPTGKWQEYVSKEIGDIKLNIEKLSSIISTHEYLINKTSEGTLVNQLIPEELPPFLRLKAFRRLLAIGKNGRVWERGFNLIRENKEAWRDVLDTELGIEITDMEYYKARLDEINRRIFDGFM
jgi:hypothetical protein